MTRIVIDNLNPNTDLSGQEISEHSLASWKRVGKSYSDISLNSECFRGFGTGRVCEMVLE